MITYSFIVKITNAGIVLWYEKVWASAAAKLNEFLLVAGLQASAFVVGKSIFIHVIVDHGRVL